MVSGFDDQRDSVRTNFGFVLGSLLLFPQNLNHFFILGLILVEK